MGKCVLGVRGKSPAVAGVMLRVEMVISSSSGGMSEERRG